MGGTPLRATAVEEAVASGASPADAAAHAAEGTEPSSDTAASAEFRTHLARVLTKRALARGARLTADVPGGALARAPPGSTDLGVERGLQRVVAASCPRGRSGGGGSTYGAIVAHVVDRDVVAPVEPRLRLRRAQQVDRRAGARAELDARDSDACCRTTPTT